MSSSSQRLDHRKLADVGKHFINNGGSTYDLTLTIEGRRCKFPGNPGWHATGRGHAPLVGEHFESHQHRNMGGVPE